MLALASTLYQFHVTVGYLSSLNYLMISLLHFSFAHTSPLFCSPYVSVRWCITFLALYHKFSVTSLFFFRFCLLFISLALQYILAFAYAWSIISVSYLDVCIFIIFKLTVFTLHLFMVTSKLKCINFVTSGLKCIHFNFSNVNVHIFIIAVCSLKA